MENAGTPHTLSEIRTYSPNVEAVENSAGSVPRSVHKDTFPECCELMAVVWLLYESESKMPSLNRLQNLKNCSDCSL
jgi:hypothetical protein